MYYCFHITFDETNFNDIDKNMDPVSVLNNHEQILCGEMD